MKLLQILTFPLTEPVEIFLLVLLIILFCPIIFRRIGIPQIVGLILAGIVVGPYGFNLLARDASFEIFGQVGILYLMFMAAVEIDMFHLRKNLKKGIIFGLITFIIPTLFGIFGSRWAFSSGWSTCVLIASMYAAHTLISYPIVSKFGVQNSQAAIIAVCSTIVAVLLALFMLAGVIDISDGGFHISRVFSLIGYMAAYAIFTGVILYYLTRYFFRRINDQVLQFIYILAMVFIESLIAKLIGLESILGAFYAGLILNRFIPDRSGLMSRIKFVGNAIFIPYFLIGVGMLINIQFIFRSWTVAWVAVNMVVVAMSAKWISAWIGSYIFHFGQTERGIMFGLTGGKAAATIAAALIGFQHGLLTEDMLNGAVLMILFSCIIASLTTQRAAKKMRIELTEREFSQDNENSQSSFARQLVAVANPITAEGLMRMALLMRKRENMNPITAVFVRNNDDARKVHMGRQALESVISVAQSIDIEVKDIERYDINVVAGITNEAKQNQATDIMIGFHRRSNIVDSFYGNMTEILLQSTNKMIIMSRCFVPVDTLSRIVVLVPDKAEYETGFKLWVTRVGNLTSQLACRIVFMAYTTTSEFIKNTIISEKLNIRHEYRDLQGFDDFILHSSEIGNEDLLIVIGSRKGSISYGDDHIDLPSHLQKHYSGHNLVIIYPEQFGGVSAFKSGI